MWDPECKGVIASGEQMFGTVTWWLFWQNGFEPLATLDDDRNGWVDGAELEGIAVWRDANTNGISEPGEVTPVEDAGITGLAVAHEIDADGTPWCAEGVRFSNGSTRPMFDWIATERLLPKP